jgi:hypothetical protein
MLKTSQVKQTTHLACTRGAPWLRYKCKWITKRVLSAIHKLGQLSLVVSVEPEPDFYHICGNMMWEKTILVNKNVGYVCDVPSLRKSKWNITGQRTGPVRQPASICSTCVTGNGTSSAWHIPRSRLKKGVPEMKGISEHVKYDGAYIWQGVGRGTKTLFFFIEDIPMC